MWMEEGYLDADVVDSVCLPPNLFNCCVISCDPLSEAKAEKRFLLMKQ